MTLRHEIIERKWPYYKSVSELINERAESVRINLDSPSFNSRKAAIDLTLTFPSILHLQFGDVDSGLCSEMIRLAVAGTAEYFNDQWWRELTFSGSNISAVDQQLIIELNVRALDKESSSRSLKWYDVFTSGLFLMALSDSWRNLETVCSWFDPSVEPEYKAGQIEDEYMLIFVLIACSLAGLPSDALDELRQKINKCRTRRPKLLYQTWETVEARDQAAFDKAFKASVEHFLKKQPAGQIYDWLAIHQSSLWLIAENRGLKFPDLSEKARAVVVTRESAGLLD